jgi:hypothetical protein
VVSKASAGALEVLPLHSCRNMQRTLADAAAKGWAVLGAAAGPDSTPVTQWQVTQPTVLVMGECPTPYLRPAVVLQHDMCWFGTCASAANAAKAAVLRHTATWGHAGACAASQCAPHGCIHCIHCGPASRYANPLVDQRCTTRAAVCCQATRDTACAQWCGAPVPTWWRWRCLQTGRGPPLHAQQPMQLWSP